MKYKFELTSKFDPASLNSPAEAFYFITGVIAILGAATSVGWGMLFFITLDNHLINWMFVRFVILTIVFFCISFVKVRAG